MKTGFSMVILGLSLSCILLGCAAKKVLTFTPQIATEFGHIITVDGTLRNARMLGYNYMDAENENFLLVERIEGHKVRKTIEIMVVGLNTEIGNQLMKYSKASRKTRLIGCELLETRGFPAELNKYEDDILQCEGWHVRRLFIVAKCEVIDENKANQE